MGVIKEAIYLEVWFTCWVRVPIIPLLIKGVFTMEILLLVNFLWLGVGLYTYLTLEN